VGGEVGEIWGVEAKGGGGGEIWVGGVGGGVFPRPHPPKKKISEES